MGAGVQMQMGATRLESCLKLKGGAEVGVGMEIEARVEMGAGATRLESCLKFGGEASGGGRGLGEEGTLGAATGCKMVGRFLEE